MHAVDKAAAVIERMAADRGRNWRLQPAHVARVTVELENALTRRTCTHRELRS